MIEGLGLKEANPVCSPGEKVTEDPKDDPPMKAQEHRRYRELAARANYLAMDRPDIQYSTKEVCRGMASPTKQDWHRLKRLGRYMVGSGRTIMR